MEMTRSLIPSFLIVAIVVAIYFAPAAADVKQIPVVRLDTAVEVSATPTKVWAFMTAGKNLVAWCPYWKSSKNAETNISKVGAVLDFTDDWGNGGRSVITYLDANKELRIAHEPNDGSYMCQARLLLHPSDTGTQLHYIEQYTDESAPKDLEQTAAKMLKEMEKTLAFIKKGVENV
jgi:hypothetical protein